LIKPFELLGREWKWPV